MWPFSRLTWLICTSEFEIDLFLRRQPCFSFFPTPSHLSSSSLLQPSPLFLNFSFLVLSSSWSRSDVALFFFGCVLFLCNSIVNLLSFSSAGVSNFSSRGNIFFTFLFYRALLKLKWFNLKLFIKCYWTRVGSLRNLRVNGLTVATSLEWLFVIREPSFHPLSSACFHIFFPSQHVVFIVPFIAISKYLLIKYIS